MSSITEVIKYEGDNSTFIWKHPSEDFNNLTQLIVHESQEAIFFMNGQALDLFGPGRYTLETQNIPKMSGLFRRTSGDTTPFHCEVYFINKTVQMSVKWGTDSKVRYIDPEYGLPLELGASGEMNLQIIDSRKLLIKLVGTMNGIAWEDRGNGFTKSLQSSFRPAISTAVKSNLTAAIKEQNINLLEIDEHLDSLGAVLREKILPDFEEYGLTIPQFYLTNLVLPEDDPNFRRIRELHTVSLQTRMMEAEAHVRSVQAETEAKVKMAQAQAEAQAGTAKAQAEAEIAAAKRTAELERQTTETEIARRQAERTVIGAQAEAAAQKAAGLAEAEVMAAKGFNQKDVLAAEVQKAYAEGLGNMGGGSGGGGIASDLVGLMAGMKAAGMAVDNMGLFNGMAGGAGVGNSGVGQPGSPTGQTVCPACGKAVPEGAKFCLECGTKIEVLNSNEMICPACGKKTPKGKFCIECGVPLVRKCPQCGTELAFGAKFCPECGTRVI